MEGFVFFYNISCYSISLLVLATSIITAVLQKKPEEWAFVVLLVASFFILFSTTLRNSVLIVFNTVPPRDILGLCYLGGLGLVIFTLPRMCHAFIHTKRKKLEMLFLSLALGLPIAGFILGGNAAGAVVYRLLIITLTCSLIYSLVAGTIYRHKRDENGKKPKFDRRWGWILRSFAWIMAILFPVSFCLDLFPELLPEVKAAVPKGLNVYAFTFLVVNICYMFFTIPLYLPKAKLKREMGSVFTSARLSRREREITTLIAEGLSYQEVADRLYISLATVKSHMLHIYTKTGARNKVELLKMNDEKMS